MIVIIGSLTDLLSAWILTLPHIQGLFPLQVTVPKLTSGRSSGPCVLLSASVGSFNGRGKGELLQVGEEGPAHPLLLLIEEVSL